MKFDKISTRCTVPVRNRREVMERHIMHFTAVKTRALQPPKDNLFSVLDEFLPKLAERDILFVTSKVLAIHQGRCVPIGSIEKAELIKREADKVLQVKRRSNIRSKLTIREHTILSSGGVDESNGNGYYILWPQRIAESAQELWEYIRRKHSISESGVIITDSHNMPLHSGALGTAIGFWGFEPVIVHRGRSDIFGRPIKSERSNVPDALAAAGVLLMGEVDEQTPLALVSGANTVTFTASDRQDAFFLDEDDDYYAPLLKLFSS
jgi:dihydrofolate synthase / folylpolyglutamate synthase